VRSTWRAPGLFSLTAVAELLGCRLSPDHPPVLWLTKKASARLPAPWPCHCAGMACGPHLFPHLFHSPNTPEPCVPIF